MSDISINPIAITDTAIFSNGFRPLFGSDDIAAGNSSTASSANETAADQGYDRGFADGEKAADAKFGEDRAAIQQLIANLQSHESEPSEELGQLIATTVEALVRQIVGTFEPDADWLQDRINVATGLIADCDAARTIALHPDDFALLGHDAAGGNLIADPAIDRGSIRIDCSQGWIESGHALYLDELRIALGMSGADQ